MSGIDQPAHSRFNSSPDNNISSPVAISVIVFMAIALYNSLELSLLIPLSFRRYRSLYFWSLLTSTILGVIPATIGPVCGPEMVRFDLKPLTLAPAVLVLGPTIFQTRPALFEHASSQFRIPIYGAKPISSALFAPPSRIPQYHRARDGPMGDYRQFLLRGHTHRPHKHRRSLQTRAVQLVQGIPSHRTVPSSLVRGAGMLHIRDIHLGDHRIDQIKPRGQASE